MKKIPTLYARNPERMQDILMDVHPACGWVKDGEGVVTRKYDGTCCLVKYGVLYKRRGLKAGKPDPGGFWAVDYDAVTRKTTGWVPVLDGPEDRWHREAFGDGVWPDGTYELCGPKVQGNPEGFEIHVLVPHAEATQYDDVVRTFDGLRDFLKGMDIEGVVFHHPDGRMAKIKKRDFGQVRR